MGRYSGPGDNGTCWSIRDDKRVINPIAHGRPRAQERETMKQKTLRLLLALTVLTIAVQAAGSRTIRGSPSQGFRPPQSLRLYVFDCGILHNSDAARYRFKKEELATLEMSVACFLIAHPKGTLVWDTGAVPDNAWRPT